jgi:hypothetical protein
MSIASRSPRLTRARKSLHCSLAAAAMLILPLTPAAAHDDQFPGSSFAVAGGHGGPVRADGHAPIGVMGDHMHKKGEWMLSYRFMHMDMEGNRIGNDEVSNAQILQVPNRFFGAPMQPPFLRIIPTRMEMDMHMLGAMYAPTDDLTLMVMANYLDKEMDHLTYNMPGTAVIGGFTTQTEGWGDTKIGGLYRLFDDRFHNHLHLNLGLSLPTGSLTERGTVLRPNATTGETRLPYAMQLGTGTFDLLPGLTYTGRDRDLSWGAQYTAEIRLEDENDEGYAWGDKHSVTGWVAYEWAPWISTSVRLAAMTQGDIDGIDPNIAGPVQTANPQFYGGERVDAFFGVNLAGQSGVLRGHRLALEVGAPIYQDLNGPQMETDWTLTVGWQKAF